MGFEEAVERALALVPEEQGMREQLRKVLSQPAMAQAMKQKTSEFWNAWVGAWTGVCVSPSAWCTPPYRKGLRGLTRS